MRLFNTCMRGACGLAAGKLAVGPCVRGRPPPVPLVGEGRAPIRHCGGGVHACFRGGGDSAVAVSGRQLWRPDEVAAIVASSARCLARVLGVSSAQPSARPATRDALGLLLLLEGVIEEPLATSSPWSAMPLQLLLAQDWAKALLSSCLADDGYVSASFTSLEASSKISCAVVLL